MRTFPFRGLAATGLVCLAVQGAAVQRTVAQPVRVESFIFGSRLLDCEVPGEPGRRYTVVLHGSPDDLEYRVARGWGYEVVNPGDASRRGYGRFGPFDDSPNNRTQFPDTCPSEVYDSFIGAKTFGASCVNQPAPAGGPCLPPEGIVFRVDVPNGAYRFVAAVGSADNTHVSRIVVEDGGQGPPASLGPNHVVLVNNHDQAAEGPGVFARVGFDGFLPPAGAVNGFVNMDENGMATGAAPSSPTLQVTAGTIRVHQMKGATIGGDGNGGNMVVLELWRVSDRFTPVERGSNWRYLQGLQEASSPANAWRELGFDDGGWSSGPAPFGYSDGPFGTDVSLLEPPMRLNYSSLYLRRTFDVPRIAAVNQLVARVDYDDGFLMWINGTEVLRVNVPGAEGSPVSFDGLASTGHESGLVEEYFLPDPTGYLLQGANVVAVQVFNVNLTSSDLRFEAEIFDPVAPDLTPPGIDLLVPAPGITVRSLRQVEVAFSEDVSGVDASDLLVDGAPATRVTGSGRGPYVFSFPERSPGPVDVAWAVDHGITDLAEFPNDFQASGWTYIVDPEAPVGNLVIAEILAVNRSGMTDEDGDRSDWIEILNQGAEVVNVGGWSLTDELDDPGKFVLPGVALGPQECLLVFASGKDRRLAGSELHANFKMSSTGEYIGLYNGEVPRELVSEIAPRFPRQRADFSYGIDSLGDLVYFETPTPCTPNSGSVEFDGFVLQPVLTPERGIYDSAVFVAMSTATPGSTIRYTLDGSEPTATRGTVYRDPVRVVGTAGRGVITLRAVAVRGGLLPSEVVTHTYVFPEHVMRQPPNPAGFPSSWNGQAADYGMDPQVVNDPGHNQLVRDGLTSIPTLSLVAPVDGLFGSSRGILANPSREGLAWERAVSAELIYPDGRQGFQVNCGLRVQGGSSTRGWKVLKVSMRLLFKGDYGPTKLRFPLFPDTPVESFDTIVLDAHLNQTWNHPSHGQRVRAQYCRDQFVSDLQNAMGGFAPHDVFAHLYVNGLYWGVYDLHERPDHSFAASYFGGDKLDYDAIRHNSSTVLNGSASAWNVMLGAARRDLSVPANYENLGLHVDVDDLIDYMLVNFYTGNDDWPHHNWYATRLRAPGAGYRIHSWDAEHVLKSRSIDRTGAANSGTPAEVYSRLRANSEFRLLFADHAQRHFSPGGALYVNPASRRWNPESPQNNVPASIYMRRIDEIDPAIACEAARWGDLRRPARPYTRNAEWAAELAWVRDTYLPNRSATVLAQLRQAGLFPGVGAPVFNRPGGRVAPGFAMTLSRPGGSGTIHYTLDGSDPRVPVSGDVSASAITYGGAVAIQDRSHVKARVRSGANWSALSEAIFTVNDPREVLRISEIMYNPPGGNGLEFLEVHNTDPASVDLSGLGFADGIRFLFEDGASLGPGEYLVLVSEALVFASRFPDVEIAGVYDGLLANGGERVALKDSRGQTILAVDYDDGGFWPIAADGLGRSLVPVDLDGDPDDAENWRASTDVGGSPGSADPLAPSTSVVVSEVLANSASPLEDAVELFNRTGSSVDVSGWYLSDRRDTLAALEKFRIPDGTVLAPGGRAVIYEFQFNGNSADPMSFALAAAGGAVYLSEADAGGVLTGYIVEARYGPQDSGVSFGRIATSEGPAFGALSERTFGVDFPAVVEEFRQGDGMDNAPPRVGPVMINEIMYHPAADREEFVELFNPTGAPIELHDGGLGRGWQLSGVLDALGLGSYEFEPGAAVPTRGFLLLVAIDPDVFRTLHAVPASVPIHGPYAGRLDNGGERLKLSRPLDVDGGVAHAVVDVVRYDQLPPWPTGADGNGSSLERIVPDAYGNDPVNWEASARDGGTPGAINTASTVGGNRLPEAAFTASPASGEAPLEVLLDATRSYDLDGSIVRYGWDFDDGATDAGAVVSHTFQTAGVYAVRLEVEDDEGAVDSSTRLISVDVDPGGNQIAGDTNQDGVLDISDAISLLQILFTGGRSPPCGGNDIGGGGNRALLDVNSDNGVDISDGIFLLAYLFTGGPAPAQGRDCTPIPGCADVCAP